MKERNMYMFRKETNWRSTIDGTAAKFIMSTTADANEIQIGAELHSDSDVS